MGLVEFADMLGIKDPGELLRVAELRQRAAKYVLRPGGFWGGRAVICDVCVHEPTPQMDKLLGG